VDTLTAEQQHQLKHDYRWWAENFYWIVAKNGELIRFKAKPGQIKLYKAIESQQAAGLPIRVRTLKSRQIGFSTQIQGCMMQRTTTRENHKALTIGHNKKTSGSLFGMGRRGYENLPNTPLIKPNLGTWNDTTDKPFMHFGESARNRRKLGTVGLDSTYSIDTANEYESGRGLTIGSLHASEGAFWPNPNKIIALFNAVSDDPDSFVADESTANGYNYWQEQWQDSEAGISSFIPVFVGWWEEPTYTLDFLNDDAKEAFIKDDFAKGPYGEEEEYLVAEFGCTMEQLHWRRRTIVDKCRSNIENFNQEYPATPEHAFIASGSTVFGKQLIRNLISVAKKWDADEGQEGERPDLGVLLDGETKVVRGRTQEHTVATSALWVPASATAHPDDHPYWRRWAEPQGIGDAKLEGRYIVSCDPAGDPTPDEKKSASHAVVVIDHRTGAQVAELETWIDSDLLADELYRVGVYFNMAIISVETTGGYGFSIVHKLHRDYHYPRMYSGKRLDTKQNEDDDVRLGWNTSRSGKDVMEDTMTTLLREKTHGIRSQKYAKQFLNYVNLGNGKHGAQPGKRTDLVMAGMIGQQIRLEERPRAQISDFRVVVNQRPYDPRSGY
jgi:hypothetical protein